MSPELLSQHAWDAFVDAVAAEPEAPEFVDERDPDPWPPTDPEEFDQLDAWVSEMEREAFERYGNDFEQVYEDVHGA